MKQKSLIVCSQGLAMTLSSYEPKHAATPCMKKHLFMAVACLGLFIPACKSTASHPRATAPVPAAASPESVSGRTVILIRTAEETCYEGSNVWKPSEDKSPRVFKFKHGNSYKPLTGSEDPGPGYLNSVMYTKTGPDTATINDAEMEGSSDYTLKFTSPTSGNVSESGGAEGMEWKARGATFIIR